MSTKGSITTSNYIDYDKALNKGVKLLNSAECNFGFYIITAINVGLRIGDILRLKHSDFEKGYVQFREEKTKKAKRVPFNDVILTHYAILKTQWRWSGNDLVFISQKGSVFSRQQINRKLKQHLKSADKNISSHSLRKSFGRRVYENNNESDKALVVLNQIYNHSSMAQTRMYLDITQEEIEDVYMNM